MRWVHFENKCVLNLVYLQNSFRSIEHGNHSSPKGAFSGLPSIEVILTLVRSIVPGKMTGEQAHRSPQFVADQLHLQTLKRPTHYASSHCPRSPAIERPHNSVCAKENFDLESTVLCPNSKTPFPFLLLFSLRRFIVIMLRLRG